MKRKKDKFEIIPKHIEKICYFCKGTGYDYDKISQTKNETEFNLTRCKHCKGTGIFIQTYYHMIYKGICFGVDTPK
jgi:DnaJ-class molecular chaperone